MSTSTKKSAPPCCLLCKNHFSNPPGSSHTWSETVYTHNKKNYCKYCYVDVIGAPNEDEADEMVKALTKHEKETTGQ